MRCKGLLKDYFLYEITNYGVLRFLNGFEFKVLSFLSFLIDSFEIHVSDAHVFVVIQINRDSLFVA